MLIRWSSSYCIAPYCVLLLRPLDANNLKSILHLLLLYYSIRFQFNQRNLLEKTTKNCCKKIERKAENTKRKIFLPQSFYFYFALLLLRCYCCVVPSPKVHKCWGYLIFFLVFLFKKKKIALLCGADFFFQVKFWVFFSSCLGFVNNTNLTISCFRFFCICDEYEDKVR